MSERESESAQEFGHYLDSLVRSVGCRPGIHSRICFGRHAMSTSTTSGHLPYTRLRCVVCDRASQCVGRWAVSLLWRRHSAILGMGLRRRRFPIDDCPHNRASRAFSWMGTRFPPLHGNPEWSSCSVLNTFFLPNHSSSRLLTIWFTVHDGVNTSAFDLVRPLCSSRLLHARHNVHGGGVS